MSLLGPLEFVVLVFAVSKWGSHPRRASQQSVSGTLAIKNEQNCFVAFKSLEDSPTEKGGNAVGKSDVWPWWLLALPTRAGLFRHQKVEEAGNMA